jgi:hypothetical protein
LSASLDSIDAASSDLAIAANAPEWKVCSQLAQRCCDIPVTALWHQGPCLMSYVHQQIDLDTFPELLPRFLQEENAPAVRRCNLWAGVLRNG